MPLPSNQEKPQAFPVWDEKIRHSQWEIRDLTVMSFCLGCFWFGGQHLAMLGACSWQCSEGPCVVPQIKIGPGCKVGTSLLPPVFLTRPAAAFQGRSERPGLSAS